MPIHNIHVFVQVFEAYVKERAEEERREKRNKLREKKDAFKTLLDDAKLHGKWVLIDLLCRISYRIKLTSSYPLYNIHDLFIIVSSTWQSKGRLETFMRRLLAVFQGGIIPTVEMISFFLWYIYQSGPYILFNVLFQVVLQWFCLQVQQRWAFQGSWKDERTRGNLQWLRLRFEA